MGKYDTLIIAGAILGGGVLIYNQFKKGPTSLESGASNLVYGASQEVGESASGLVTGLIQGILQGTKDGADNTREFFNNMFDEWKQMAAANQAAANQENINAIKALMAEKGIKELPTDQQTEAADTPKKAIALIDSYTNKIYGSTSTSSESYTDTLKNKTPTKIKISSNLQSITISQPKRDNAGLSAIDRVIQANKGWSDSEALANLT